MRINFLNVNVGSNIFVFAVGPVVDIPLWAALVAMGSTVGNANIAGLLISAAVVYGVWIRRKDLPTQPARARAGRFWTALILAFFLRGGILAWRSSSM